MSHTEQRLLLRAAHTMADKYAGTANFQSFLELVSNEAYEMLQHPPQVKPEETALFLSQSWCRPIEGGPAKELRTLGDENLDLTTRKHALDNLISLANSHFLDGQFLDEALPVFFDILEVLPDVLTMFSKLLESEEPIIQKKSFAAVASFIFRDDVDLSKNRARELVMLFGKVLHRLPEYWRRHDVEILESMTGAFFDNFQLSHQIVDLLEESGDFPGFLNLWWSILDVRRHIVTYAKRMAAEIAEVLNGGICSPTRTSNLVSILVHFYVFTVSNRFRQQLRLLLVNSLSPSYHSKIARQLASHGVCALGLLVQCTNAELKEIHAITAGNTRQPLVKLDKFMEKRAGRRS